MLAAAARLAGPSRYGFHGIAVAYRDGYSPWRSSPAVSWPRAPASADRPTVRLDRSTLEVGDHPASLVLESNSSEGTLNLSVTAVVAEDPPWSLDHLVLDAEYDRNSDVVVTVSADPARLHVIDPVGRSVSSVDLPLTPANVSVSPDGSHAAVGHDAFVSHVDLSSLVVLETHPIPVDVWDLVLAGNGVAYAMPASGQWTRIYGLDLATGTVSQSTGNYVRHRTVLRLHPSGDYMYGANTDLSPSDFEKYDIRSGVAELMYDSPYHGDYSFGGDIWIADDGGRLFARSGNVFRSSTSQSEDMTYAGSLDEWMRWVEHSSAASRIFAVPGGHWTSEEPTQIQVYDPQFLAYQGSVDLPRFRVPTASGTLLYASFGRFAFVSSSGDLAHVLVEADPESGMSLDWGIATFEVAELP